MHFHNAAELTRNVTPPDSKWHDAANDAVNLIAQYMSVVNLDEEVFEILKKHHELRLLKRNDIIKCDSGAAHLSERATSSTPPCPSDEALSLEEAYPVQICLGLETCDARKVLVSTV